MAKLLGENYPVPIKRVGLPGVFGESGGPKELLEKYSLIPAGIAGAVFNMFEGCF